MPLRGRRGLVAKAAETCFAGRQGKAQCAARAPRNAAPRRARGIERLAQRRREAAMQSLAQPAAAAPTLPSVCLPSAAPQSAPASRLDPLAAAGLRR